MVDSILLNCRMGQGARTKDRRQGRHWLGLRGEPHGGRACGEGWLHTLCSWAATPHPHPHTGTRRWPELRALRPRQEWLQRGPWRAREHRSWGHLAALTCCVSGSDVAFVSPCPMVILCTCAVPLWTWFLLVGHCLDLQRRACSVFVHQNDPLVLSVQATPQFSPPPNNFHSLHTL